MCIRDRHIANVTLLTFAKNPKIAIFRPPFEWSQRNLARWRSSMLLLFWNFENPRWRRPPFVDVCPSPWCTCLCLRWPYLFYESMNIFIKWLKRSFVHNSFVCLHVMARQRPSSEASKICRLDDYYSQQLRQQLRLSSDCGSDVAIKKTRSFDVLTSPGRFTQTTRMRKKMCVSFYVST